LLLDPDFDMRNDRAEQPLSQFNMNEYSQMIDHDMSTYQNGDDASQTESELDDEQAECLNLVKQVPLKISTFREYLFWQAQNKVVDGTEAEAQEAPQANTQVESEEPSGEQQVTLDDLLNEAKSNNTPATIDTKTESPVVDNKTFPQDEGQQPRHSGVDLGKRRTRNPSLITDIIGKIRQPENQPYHEQELLMASSDSDSDDNMRDPRSNTQLCNNDSIAQCSQDTYEEQQFAIQHKQEVLSAQQQQQE